MQKIQLMRNQRTYARELSPGLYLFGHSSLLITEPLGDTKNPWRHYLSFSRLTFATVVSISHLSGRRNIAFYRQEGKKTVNEELGGDAWCFPVFNGSHANGVTAQLFLCRAERVKRRKLKTRMSAAVD